MPSSEVSQKQPSVPPSPPDAQSVASSCPLLELSPELRNHCYEYAFAPDKQTSSTQVDLRIAKGPSKALLQTCKQIYAEAGGLYKVAYLSYWKDNKFVLDLSSLTLEQDIDRIAPIDLDAIELLTATYAPKGPNWRYVPGCSSHGGFWQRQATKTEPWCACFFRPVRGDRFALTLLESLDVMVDIRIALSRQLRGLIARYTPCCQDEDE